MCTWAAIVDVAKYVKLVDGQTLDDVADGADKIVGTTCRNDGVYNHAYVGCLVVVAQTLVQQFLDDIRKIGWERLAHLGTGVLAAHVATHLDQLVDGDAIPVFDILLLSLDKFKFLFGIVDECAEFLLLALAYIVTKQLVNLTLDVARGIFQDMSEGIAFAVDIGQKVLGAFRQCHDSLEVYYLSRRFGDSGKRLG